MYPNLRAEIARKNTTYEELARVIGVTKGTMSQKATGKYQFSLDEAIAIKDALGVDISLEELFEKEEV